VVFGSLAALLFTAAACTGTSSSLGRNENARFSSGLQALNRGGTPRKGGTLTMLGAGDVDFMDYNISYYTIGSLGLRLWARNLYAYPAIPGHTTSPVPDLATAAPVETNHGRSFTVTIRAGAMWDTSPPRQVTAADALLGLKRACNPAQPFGGVTDFEDLIQGYAAFCTGFAKVKQSVAAIRAYLDSHQIPGVTASGQTITYRLTHPASSFGFMLTMSPFNPVPAESLNYLPASHASQQHTIADGPYRVQSYAPARKIVFVRNPAWRASSDPIRKAYVDQINVTETAGVLETGFSPEVQQILQTDGAAGGMEWDVTVPPGAVPGLAEQMRGGGQTFGLGPTYSALPFVTFNLVSPNNHSALARVAVRQAISYAINRSHLIQVLGGPALNPPLTHILPDGINGAQYVPRGYNRYPYHPARARSMLAAAGYPNGLPLKLLYQTGSSVWVRVFQALQADLSQAGISVHGAATPSGAFWTKYLGNPSVAKAGTWDLAVVGWSPDWYGDAAASFFKPQFSGPSSYPPEGSNLGFYDNPTVTSLINKAAAQASATTAARMWARIDQDVMNDAAIYPIAQPLRPLYHASYVHNAVYVPAIWNFDPTNVWLSNPPG
jgi:peptide/nickel transport system substrate-binding protein